MFFKRQKRESGAGFTIIELIVVIAIIVVLAGIVTASVLQFLPKAKDSKKIADVKAYAQAAQVYFEQNGVWPHGENDDNDYLVSCCLGEYDPDETCWGSGAIACSDVNVAFKTVMSVLPTDRTPVGENNITGYVFYRLYGSTWIFWMFAGENQDCGIGQEVRPEPGATFCSYKIY